MKLKFKRQQYQENAVQSVVDCFNGQTSGVKTNIMGKRSVITDITNWNKKDKENVIFFGNKEIELSTDELRKNIRKVQKQNNIEYTDDKGFENYSIEMETGTGKTYTYIKTMYELNKNYGWSKFIVMTPSIAIREGALKSFQITEEHFQEMYGKKIRYFVYNSNNSSNLSNINNFAEDNSIQVMIINYQAFNTRTKENRKIYEELDELQSRRPIEVIKATNPILIVDEPQKMGKTESMLNEFNPLFILRYSATHKSQYKYNMIYRLDAVDAYNQKLVKKINVKGIEVLHNKSDSTYLYLERVEVSKSEPLAKIEIEVKSKNGVRKTMKTVKQGADLYELSEGLEEYKGYKVSQINAKNQSYDKVTFFNGEEIITGQIKGDSEGKCIARIQIRETIKSHFEKEIQYFRKGIKVLSLFFIDEVAKYKIYDDNKIAHDGEYAQIFEEEYNKIYNEYYKNSDEEYKKYLDFLKNKKVHAGYFSVDKKASKGLPEGQQIFIDSKIDDKKEGISSDEEAYDLIMRDKERLLSMEEPVRFIFSHSALREGWDNPNIFQICTLKKSNSEISKRQEIGRGLRICVNDNGERMDYSLLEEDFFRINNLTVIASESYESFAESLQKEIAENLARKTHDIFEYDLFEGKELKNSEGKFKVIDSKATNQIYRNFIKNEYIDEQDNITETLRDCIEQDKIDVPEIFNEFKEEYTNLIKSLFSNINIPLENKGKENIKNLKTNDNFKMFEDMWNKINIKTVYQVNFNSDDLIKNAIRRLNKDLKISKMRVRLTEGSQNNAITSEQIKSGISLNEYKTKVDVYDDFIPVTTKYDLIGNLSKDTGLTRKTIISILEKIKPEIFKQYPYNPEEFIIKATNLIKEEKALAIVDGITYSKLDERFSDKIFDIKNINGRIGDNAIEVKKHIYDYLVTDSKNEINFAKKLEVGEVKVYAKLPSKFKIPTPLGNYNPDWAIVFDNDKFEYVYFIAETKGSILSKDLRKIEEAKTICAQKHFEAISDGKIKYGVVDSYEELINKVTEVNTSNK